ncbi:hypothetical protein CN918_31380 [Priestia megaterium]|nr:hypothetical protein CN918_31380 [Priestia megaterium]
MKGLAFGLVLTLVAVLIGWFSHDVHMFHEWTLYMGAGALGLSFIVSGALVSGDRFARNTSDESSDDRKDRLKLTFFFFLSSLPCWITYAVTYFILNK